MTPESIMPFGKYQGMQLRLIPGSYLLYLESKIAPMAPNKRTLNEKLLLTYIQEYRDVLNK